MSKTREHSFKVKGLKEMCRPFFFSQRMAGSWNVLMVVVVDAVAFKRILDGHVDVQGTEG